MFAGPRDLEAVSLDEAQERWHNELEFRGLGGAGPVEEIDVTRALGRVSAQSVMARRPSPHYYAAAVDGLAVKSTRTFGATPGKPVRVHLAPDATFVDTGSALPEGTDAVVPISELQFVNAEEVDVLEPSVPWRFVSPMGEDMEAAEVIVPNHRRIRPSDMGAMLRGGVARLRVGIRPRVAFLPVGGYLVPPGTEPAKGQRVESITTILGALTEQIGADPVRMDIVAERTEALDEVLTLERRKQFDLLVIISGKSHGSALPAAWVAHHGSLVVYGANIKPGHSVALGMVDQLPVIVLPGNAVSSYIAFDLFARPLIARRLGLHDLGHVMLSAVLGQGIVSPHGIDEFLRINLTRVDGKRIAFPISRGADIVTSLVRASGILHVPADAESIPDGTPVEVQLLDPQASLEGNILLVGTYDPAFDLLRNAIARRNSDVHLQSANVGSRAGLRALRKGYAHAAGLHLFDDETGTYNIHHLQENMPDTPITLINFFKRFLGFIVKKGNPKNILGFSDLTRPEVTFINRQHGSGTRVLIDHHLRKAAVDTARVKGYDKETYTHMSLAATVASGAADVGIGIATVARGLDLEFVPLISEQLDLAIPRRHLKSYPMQAMLNVLRSADFRKDLDAIRHQYDTSETGTVVYEG